MEIQENYEMDFEDDLTELRKAAEAGDVDAMMRLADSCIHSFGTEAPDLLSACKWYERAAEKGLTDAMMALGELYEYRSRYSSSDAIIWYEKAFANGDRRAAGALMRYHYSAQDYEKVYEWILKEQEQDIDSPDVQYFLGLLYMKGIGSVPQDGEKARTCLEKAAEAGNFAAMLVLGDMYRDGACIAADREKALSWYKKAKDADLSASLSYWQLEGSEANDWIFEVVRDMIVQQMGLDAEEIERKSRLIDDLGVDSLDVVELIMDAEELFGTEIMDEEAEAISTVQDIVETLLRKYRQEECSIETGERPHMILYTARK